MQVPLPQCPLDNQPAKHTRATGECGRQCPLGQEPCGEHGEGCIGAAPHCRPWVRPQKWQDHCPASLRAAGVSGAVWPPCQAWMHLDSRPWPAGVLPQGRERQRQPMAHSTAGLEAAHGLTSLLRGRGPGRKPCLSPASGPASNVHPPWILWRHGRQDVTFQVWAPGEEGSKVGGERGRREGGERGEGGARPQQEAQPVSSAPSLSGLALA